MKRNRDSLGAYFSSEVGKKRIPPFPGRRAPVRRIFRRDDLLTLVVAAAVFVALITPGIYDSRIRQSGMCREYYAELGNTIPRIIYDAALYLQEQTGSHS